MKILITPTSMTEKTHSAALDTLRVFADTLVFNPMGRPLNAQELIALLDGVDGVIAGLDAFDESVINAAPDMLRVISRYGAGYDRVDIRAAAKRGILVTNTPGANSDAVSDLALGLMLCAARKIPMLDKSVREGKWVRNTGIELSHKKLGIVGLGAIGKGVARRAQGFAMHVLAYDPYADKKYMSEQGIENAVLDDLLQESDFVSLHLPLNDQTWHIIGSEAIGRMKPGAVLVNTSRGGLIDENAVYEALKSGKLGGLGLDAFETEPPGTLPLFELDNVVFTPHTGAHTKEAVEKMAELAVCNLINVLSGRVCPYAIKGEP